ncbi:uncharacterized protein Z519_11742 [Cladophialophora bantiana CBS 173.52]|uniref:Heterokaryon incompatibility domain-containing protein n=1 Tax=Cladophialophora bantiana (strain ATCC 10958 / CBS 173.52 / CDC B-1940 / NIH 8579) TaxID=1442370 RepID=A0A0D2H365_CLAB1|nr:uncharacterized protein Z519_11742 [Cladophialophora bantiana CBS 173.52]KIW87768.1 hypothetical protein Z519_11742 [Cladophialophora bantiana CBS 173.52]
MNDDTGRDFDELRASRPTSLVSELLEIQKYQRNCPRDFTQVRSLKCLSPRQQTLKVPDPTLFKVTLPEDDGKFAAVSYVWNPSAYENDTTGRYRIMPEHPGRPKRSKVRDVILDRVVRYTVSGNIPAFWIDQECINQSDEKAKIAAMQSMDIIYRRSQYPVGVLSTPVRCQREIDCLLELLNGELVTQQWSLHGPKLTAEVNIEKARDILDVLFRVMCDPWWGRRWISQEEYCAMDRMRLLIPHKLGLRKARGGRIFGNIDGELSINAACFRQQVTLFCIACHRQEIWTSTREKWRCRLVLRRAKKYNMLQKYGWIVGDYSDGRAMSTRILADISRRSAKIPSDTLAIVANCCGYATRLDVETLSKARLRSLSLAILALFVLNGEILRNDTNEDVPCTVVDFLKRQSFQGFDPPRDDRKLTFMKRCRLSDVVLSEEGIKTHGYCWTRCKIFMPRCLASSEKGAQWHQDILRQLAEQLHGSYRRLADNIRKYLQGTMPGNMKTAGLREIFKSMAEGVAEAVEAGRPLILAQLAGHDQIWAVFVATTRHHTRSHIFTSCEPAEGRSSGSRSRPLDKYVSLQVVTSGNADSGIPRLRTGSWVNGLWFVDRIRPQEVIFPWPRFLSEE